MKNTILTAGEIMRINTNLREIEKYLGCPIPGGVIDVNDLKDHVLTAGEVMRMCTNLREIRKATIAGRTNYGHRSDNTNLSLWIAALPVIAAILYAIIASIIV